jgi:GMP synthase-like glutamine amidotransferase
MRLTILQTGEVPEHLRARFGTYVPMFHRMFEAAGADFDYETVSVRDNARLPPPAALEAILITGSAAGVYDDLPWLGPLRAFVRKAYDAGTPMVGVCFGHQIMADALGGSVRKSEKGWGLGHHTYQVWKKPPFMAGAPDRMTIPASHQDQVIAPPADADVFLATEFTPFAGLVYRNGAAVSLQPHPEFDRDYAGALAEARRGNAPDERVDKALASLDTPADSLRMAQYLVRFLTRDTA